MYKVLTCGVLAGISDVRDESDRDGMRVVVEVKRGSSPEVTVQSSLLVCSTWCMSEFCCITVHV